MLSRLIVVVLLCTTLALATRVKIYNYCSQELPITEKLHGERTLLCNLYPGSYCYKDYTLGKTWYYFQNGYNANATSVEVAILRDGYDSKDTYVIFAPSGSDFPVEVSANNGGRTLNCTDDNCNDAYDRSYTIIDVNHGGAITINYCPDNMGVFKKLKLIESFY
ncbi:hypothetical protein FO519_009343 [Halicephalobus sp. NKZ332]|nr:hypothetical protein FO519_009343 [Halicephalobus sp. NKZ332]